MKPVDESQYEPVESAPQQPAMQPIDESQYEALPSIANGMSPETPINKSPLSVVDRAKLVGLSNEKGKLGALKERFGEVKKDSEGNLVVKDNGIWHRVDADNFGDADPWTVAAGVGKMMLAGPLAYFGQEKVAQQLVESNPVSKELTSEIADNLPLIAAGAAGAGGAAVAAPYAAAAIFMGSKAAAGGILAGAAATSAGAVEGVRTSLGRIVDTYDATPEEQAKDIGIEMMLALGGEVFALGVKPTSGMMEKAAAKLGEKLSGPGAASKEFVKHIYSFFTGRKIETIDTIAEAGKAVGQEARSLRAASPRATGVAMERRSRDIADVEEMAGFMKRTVDSVMGKQHDELAKIAGQNFSADIPGVADDILTKAMSDGFVGVKKVGEKSPLSIADMQKLLAESEGKIPKGFVPHVYSPRELKTIANALGDAKLDEIATDSKAYMPMRQLLTRVAGLRDFTSKQGREGVEQLLTQKRSLTDFTWGAKQRATRESIKPIVSLMSEYSTAIKEAVEKRFDKSGAGEAYRSINDAFEEMRGSAESFLDAAAEARNAGREGQSEIFEKLLNKINSRPTSGSNQGVKDSIDLFAQTAEKYGFSGAKIRELRQQLRIRDAAHEVSGWAPQGLASQGAAAAAGGAAATGKTDLAKYFATATAIRSPRVGYFAQQGAQNLLDAGYRGKDFITKMSRKQINDFLSNPELVGAFATTITKAPLIQEQVKEQLLSPMAQPPEGQ